MVVSNKISKTESQMYVLMQASYVCALRWLLLEKDISHSMAVNAKNAFHCRCILGVHLYRSKKLVECSHIRCDVSKLHIKMIIPVCAANGFSC